MSRTRTIGLYALGTAMAALIGGASYWLIRRYQRKRARPKPEDGPTPSMRTAAEDPEPDDGVDRSARGRYLRPRELPAALEQAVNELFDNAWPPTDEVIDKLTPEDFVVIAVESDPVPGYELERHELINARVLSVEQTMVRARVVGPVEYAEHIGNHAGHGFRVGDLLEVPRTAVLVAARSTAPRRSGFNSRGEAAGVFEPSHETKQTYTIRPSTPYDLVLAYRSPELEWVVERENVTMKQIGVKGDYQQILFTEDSLRGPVIVRVFDRDPKQGLLLVGRWDFNLAP